VSAAPLILTIPLAAFLAVLAAAAAVMARRGSAGSLTRSGRLGVHTPAAMASDEAFALANRVAAPVAAGAAVVAGVLAVLVIVLPLNTLGSVIVWILGFAGSMALLVVSGVLGDRAARQVPIPARRPGPASGGGCSGCACGGGGCAGLTRTDPAATGSA
jgi:SdpI/YfhL protein family